MIEADRILLAELSRLNRAIPELAMQMMDGSLSREGHLDLVRWMADVAEAVRLRANRVHVIEIDGNPAALAGPSGSSVEQ